MKNSLLLALLVPAVVLADVWRPGHFEIDGWRKSVPADDAKSNVFSPIGLAVSLAMLGEGTGGEHRVNISEALGLLSDFGSAFSYVFQSYAQLSASNTVSITFAPSIWARKLKKFDIDYRRSLQRNFEAETGLLTSSLAINAWTEAKTDGRIAQLVEKVDPRTEVLLANAVAFEGAWAKGFDRNRTADRPFRCDDGRLVQVPTMHGECNVAVISNEHAYVARVPFAAPGVSMLYLLPPAGQKLASFRDEVFAKFSIDEMKTIFRTESGAELKHGMARLALPRMEIASHWNLLKTLAAFKVPQSGYARIGPDFKINEVVQVDYIKIVETGYSLTPGVLPPSDKKAKRHVWQDEEEDEPQALPKIDVKLDRPFLFFVWDENSDTLILSGQFTGRDA